MPPSVEARSGCGPHASPSACCPMPSPACFACHTCGGDFQIFLRRISYTTSKSRDLGENPSPNRKLILSLKLKTSKTNDPFVFFLALFPQAKIAKNPFWKPWKDPINQRSSEASQLAVASDRAGGGQLIHHQIHWRGPPSWLARSPRLSLGKCRGK